MPQSFSASNLFPKLYLLTRPDHADPPLFLLRLAGARCKPFCHSTESTSEKVQLPQRLIVQRGISRSFTSFSSIVDYRPYRSSSGRAAMDQVNLRLDDNALVEICLRDFEWILIRGAAVHWHSDCTSSFFR
jgi:hypothetical protein